MSHNDALSHFASGFDKTSNLKVSLRLWKIGKTILTYFNGQKINIKK